MQDRYTHCQRLDAVLQSTKESFNSRVLLYRLVGSFFCLKKSWCVCVNKKMTTRTQIYQHKTGSLVSHGQNDSKTCSSES
jgi:hypothetical protein